mgnify:CR=1 FL=1
MTFERQVSFKSHPHEWIVEALREHQTYFEKNMFSCRACYCHEKLMLVLASNKEDEWNGLLIPTEREFHPSLILEFPELCSHPVLGKWLYIPAQAEEFEDIALKIAELANKNDLRIGVIPGKKQRNSSSKKKVKNIKRTP